LKGIAVCISYQTIRKNEYNYNNFASKLSIYWDDGSRKAIEAVKCSGEGKSKECKGRREGKGKEGKGRGEGKGKEGKGRGEGKGTARKTDVNSAKSPSKRVY